MVIKRNILVVALGAAMVLTSAVARADGESPSSIQSLENRLLALEDRLAANESVISTQRQLLERQTPPVSQGSAVDSFFNSLEVGGHVTASYIYNNNKPDNLVGSQVLCQFNCDHNGFKLDAAKFELGKSADKPGEAGFQLDLVFGENGGILGGFGGVAGSSDNFVHVQEGYVSYNYNDILLTLGKFETLLGAEVIDSPYNPNISHGVLFTFAIPLVHNGLLASGSLSEQVGWALGFTNGFNNAEDTNDSKGWLAQLSFEDGPLFASVQGYYGVDGDTGFTGNSAPRSFNTDASTIIDVVTTYQLDDATSLWLNADWGEQEDVTFLAAHPEGPATKDAEWWGIAVGLNHQLNDRMNIVLRGEYFTDDEGYRVVADDDVVIRTLTGTLGYKLADNLKARFEVRYDNVDSANRGGGTINQVFGQGSSGTDDDAIYGIFEVSYVFD